MMSFYHSILNSATYQSLDNKGYLISKCLFGAFNSLKKKNLLGQKYFVCFLQELKERKTNRHLKSTDLYIGCRALVKFLNPGQGEAVLVNYPDFRNN